MITSTELFPLLAPILQTKLPSPQTGAPCHLYLPLLLSFQTRLKPAIPNRSPGSKASPPEQLSCWLAWHFLLSWGVLVSSTFITAIAHLPTPPVLLRTPKTERRPV